MSVQIDTLKKVVETKLKGKFVYANVFESNVKLDKIKSDEYPVFVYVAPGPIDNEDTEFGAPDRTFNIFGFWLTRIPNISDDYDTEKVQPYIDAMSKQADKLVAQLCLEKISEREAIKKWRIIPTYSKYDSAVFGVSLQFDWLTNDGLRICTE